MITHRKILFLAVVATVLGGGERVEAQLRASLSMSKKEFVAHEAVVATITLTNDAGHDLLIHTDGRTAVDWLDFQLKDSRGTSLSPQAPIDLGAVTIPAGRSISKSIDLTSVYRVTKVGRYRCAAVIRLPRDGGRFLTNAVPFTVTLGRRVYTQRVGDPENGTAREYRLSVHSSSRKSSLYLHLVDLRTGRTLQAFRMGEVISRKTPKALVDRHNNLHVLFLAAPNVYGHGTVTPSGRYAGSQYYKPAPGRTPALVTFQNGDVVLSGGLSYDPREEVQRRAQIRKLSERPRLTFR
ncbi:MAG: hypothetical protein CMO40_02185 [Verrucomicrobiaceae bacterium]|nr:hypothetical protein [Verrucomicrobiaceae bacterium]